MDFINPIIECVYSNDANMDTDVRMSYLVFLKVKKENQMWRGTKKWISKMRMNVYNIKEAK